jgi:hypothetical protein
VGPDGFEFRIEEWVYLDGSHTEETASYLVMEAGTYTLDDGMTVEVGTTDVPSAFKEHSFSQSFSDKPIVFSQSQTKNGWQSVVTRQQNVTVDGLELKVQEEENGDWHKTETVGYVALNPSTSSGGSSFELGTTGKTVTHQWSTVDLTQSFSSTPFLVACMQTTEGWHPAGLRYRNLSSDGFEVFAEEEQSDDEEIRHAAENIGYLLFDPDSVIYKQ